MAKAKKSATKKVPPLYWAVVDENGRVIVEDGNVLIFSEKKRARDSAWPEGGDTVRKAKIVLIK